MDIEFKDFLSSAAFGRKVSETQPLGNCVACGEFAEPKIHTPEGLKEFEISGMCEECFDALFEE